MLVTLIAVALLSQGTGPSDVAPPAAQTDNAQAPASVTATPAKPPKPKLICEEGATTGSRIGSYRCLTAEQWDERSRHDKDYFTHYRDQAGTTGQTPGLGH